MAISLIQLGELLERLEMIVIIIFLVCVFIKISICVFAVCNGISKVFGFNDYKFIATPVSSFDVKFLFYCLQKYHGNVILCFQYMAILFLCF